MWGLAIVSAVAGLVKLGSKHYSKNVQKQENEKELERAKNNLTDSYNLSVKQKNESTNLMVTQEENARQLALDTAGNTMALQNQIDNEQRAELAIQASQAEGQATQQVATSGFRNTGSANNVIKNAQTNNTLANNQFELGVTQSKYTSYQQALGSYLDSNATIERYQLSLTQELDSLKLEYDQQLEKVQNDLDYLHSGEYLKTEIFAGSADLLEVGASAYKAYYGA